MESAALIAKLRRAFCNCVGSPLVTGGEAVTGSDSPSGEKNKELKPGGFLWHDSNSSGAVENRGGEIFQALIITV